MNNIFCRRNAAVLFAALPCIVAAAKPPGLSVQDLVSHLQFLERTPQPQRSPQTNFEIGLASQILADEANVSAGSRSIGLLGEDDLRMKAEESYTACLDEDPSNADALSNLANLLSHGAVSAPTPRILELYERALASDPLHFQGYLNYGTFLRQQVGRHSDAALVFERGLRYHPGSTALSFELAFTFELLGQNDKAASIYEEIIAIDPDYTSALLNLSALYHKRLLLDDAIGLYSRALSTIESYERDCFQDVQSAEDLFTHIRSPFADYDHGKKEGCICSSTDDAIKILSNKGLALRQLGRYTESIACFQEVMSLLKACDASGQPSKDYLTASVDLFISAKAGCFFSAWSWLGSLLSRLDELDLNDGTIPSLKPFDTLSLPVSPSWKRKLADLYSKGIENDLAAQRYRLGRANNGKQKLRLGFMSHDFSYHPTTFLFEGIVVANKNSSSIDIAAYSYGVDDGSKERKELTELLGDAFFDISSMSHEDAIRVVSEDSPHIIFDMQGFTLGSRPQLMASRCANIQVSFLAFPGTTGSSFIDYVIVDRHVAAIERAEDEFTEKLAILPRSYQANYFVEPVQIPIRGSDEWAKLREKEGLSTSKSVFVFANLNKQDKIDPESFLTWMHCLRRVEDSVIWLLEPSQPEAAKIIKKNLRSNAEAAGISPDRIIFAKKVNRMAHLRRMAAGDLFLDTFLYGGHTTATDALRGGMPLLTLAGDSFSSRVGMSLLHGMNSRRGSSLIAYDSEEFIDAATEIASAQIALAKSRLPDKKSIAERFLEPDEKSNNTWHTTPENELFDWKLFSKDLEDLSKMMLEVERLSSESMNIVLAGIES